LASIDFILTQMYLVTYKQLFLYSFFFFKQKTAYEMYVRPKNKLVAEFLGTANALQGRVVRTGNNGSVETEFGPIAVDLSSTEVSSNESVFVMIRPEDMTCSREPSQFSENIFE